jgi:hypothetical protein
MAEALSTSIAFESRFRHEVEMVLEALHEGGVPAADVGQTNLGVVQVFPDGDQTAEAFWYVIVPQEQLAVALKVIESLPVSRRERPTIGPSETKIGQGTLGLAFGIAGAFLLALYMSRC